MVSQTRGEPSAPFVLGVTASARPKRVAILIPLDAMQLADLDLLTQECGTYWGGGYWPIIPTDGHTISDDWWTVLEAVDADVIIAACALEQALCQRIHRRLAPARLDVRSTDASRAGAAWHLRDVAALDAYEVAHYHAQMQVYPKTRFLYLTDSAEVAADRAFVLRNFGLLKATFRTDSALQSIEHDRLAVHEVTKLELLGRFTSFAGELVVPRDLSRLHAPRPFDLEYDPVADAFHLIVGDTINEALYTWNRPLMSPGHAGRDYLWIDAASARNSETVKGVGEWIRRVFWPGQQQRGARIVTFSEDADTLRDVCEIIRKIAWVHCDSLRLDPEHFPIRPRPGGRRLVYHSPFDDAPRRTEQVPMSEQRGPISARQGLVGVPRPAFVRSASKTDGWMLDLDIEYSLDPRRYTNQSDSWRLPRRARLGQLFSTGRRQSRIVVGGLPSVSVAAAESSFTLLEPTKRSLLLQLLEADPDCSPLPRGPRVVPSRRFNDVATSEQGRRFQGLLDLIGSVGDTGQLFEDSFWRAVLLDAAGKPLDDIEERTDAAARVLTAELAMSSVATGANTPDQSIPGRVIDVMSIARKVAMALHRVPSGLRTLTRKELKNQFGKIKGQEQIGPESGRRPLRFEDDGERELEWLLALRVLLQGVVLTCPICGIQQWRGVDDIRSVIRCEGCTTDFPLPPEPQWRYRQNALVQSALARDGVLPLVRAIHNLTQHARDMALVIAPQNLRESVDGPLITDLDLLLVVDGVFTIGEVKSSPAAFGDSVLSTLADVTLSVRPDRLVLAAPGSTWPNDVSRRVDELRRTMEASDVEVMPLLLDQ